MNSAIKRCLQSLKDHPRNVHDMQVLEKLLLSGEIPSYVEQALLNCLEHHRNHRNWEAALRIIDLELFSAKENMRRVELLMLKGQILEDELLDEHGAAAAFTEVINLEPENKAAQEALSMIQLYKEHWESIVAKYLEEAEHAAVHDRELAAALFNAAAKIIWKRDPQEPMVENHLRRSLEVEPRNPQANAIYERLLIQQQRFKELVSHLKKRADIATTKEERVEAFLAAGDVLLRDLGDVEGAVKRFKRALILDPINPRIRRALEQVFIQQEDWNALIRHYDETLHCAEEKNEIVEMLVRIGRLYHEKLNQSDKAEVYFRRVRNLAPMHPEMQKFYRIFNAG